MCDKTKTKQSILRSQGTTFPALILLSMLAACSDKDFTVGKVQRKGLYSSAMYNHFEGGRLFHDVDHGLNVLWEASFRNKRVYKENLGYFVSEGLLILPNRENTNRTARLSALQTEVSDGKFYVKFEGRTLKVLGIIHTHPEGLPTPAPRYDYQYGFMGIHNYVMSYHDLYDAYKDAEGYEVCSRLGPRKAYEKIPSYLRNPAPKLKTADLAIVSQ